MKLGTKIKLGVFAGSALFLIGATGYEYHNWTSSYKNIEERQIESFSKLWESIWDPKTKTFNDKIEQGIIQKMEPLAETPADAEKLKLAKSSVFLMQVKNHSSTIEQYLAAVKSYYEATDVVEGYKEQKALNDSVVESIEKLVNQLNSLPIKSLTIDNLSLTFAQAVKDMPTIPLVETDLKWEELEGFNFNIKSINELVQNQIAQDDEGVKQTAIINLKGQLDEFVSKANSYRDAFKSNYTDISTLKTIIGAIQGIDLSKNGDWVSELEGIGDDAKDTSYSVYLTDRFFSDNSSLSPYKDYLKSIPITVQLKRQVSTTNKKTDEGKSQTAQMQDSVKVTQSDEDIINKNTLKNLKFYIIQNQKVVKYVEPTPPSSSSSSRPSSSRREEPSATRPDSNNQRTGGE